MRLAKLVVVAALLATSPALAFNGTTVINWKTWPWSKEPVFGIGAEIRSQHYATAKFTKPNDTGIIEVNWMCENGAPGTSYWGLFVLEFRQGDNVLASVSRECQMSRSDKAFGIIATDGQQTSPSKVLVDLSKVLDRVDNIKLTAHPIPIPPNLKQPGRL